MKCTPIPDDEIMPDHARVLVVPAKDQDPTIPVEAVEMLVTTDEKGIDIFRARVELEDDEAARLSAGEPLWVSFYGGVAPFSVNMTEPGSVSGDSGDRTT